jgi:anaerobic selenocysteine-containing dehydrogenase
MTATRAVHPSISRTPLPLVATDLPTVCVLCSHNCGLRVDVADGRIVAVRADERNPITAGYVCNKGFGIPHHVRHAERADRPLRRRPDGGFAPVGWVAAIAEIAAGLTESRARHSARAIGLVGVGGQANHLGGAYALGWLRALGSRRWFNAFAQEKTQHSLMDQWMFEASPTTFLHADQAGARFLLVLGTNPCVSHRGHNATEFFPRFTQDPGRTLVAVDPRETETTRGASRHLRVQPGTDAYLLLGMAATIAAHEGLLDAAFVLERTAGFETLRRALAAVDVSEMARRCGSAGGHRRDRDGLRAGRVGRRLRRPRRRADALLDARLLSRPRSSCSLEPRAPRRNVFFETLLPPVQEPAPARARARARLGHPGHPRWATSACSRHARARGGLARPSRASCGRGGRGCNPFLSYSDTARWREARARLDLLVVIEPAVTETARTADWVLPAPVGYEKWEFANFPKGYPEIFVQVRPPVVPGPAEALPEPEIYARLAEAMGLVGEVPAVLHELAPGALAPEGAARFLAVAQELAAADPHIAKERLLFWTYRALGPHLPSPALAAIWLQCHLNAMLRTASVLRTLGPAWETRGPFEIAAEVFRRILDHPEGVEVARVSEDTNLADHVGFEDGRVRLAPEPMLAEIGRALATPPREDPEYPFVLAAGLRTRWTANTIQRDPGWRKGRGPHCALALAPADAARVGVRDGDPVRVTTRRGMLTLPAQLDPRLLPGAWMPNGPAWFCGRRGRRRDRRRREPERADGPPTATRSPIPHHRHVRCHSAAG